jgi:hypothetical protein
MGVGTVVLMKAHQIEPSPCPGCGEVLDGASGLNTDNLPTPGAATICVYCGSPLLFDEGLQLRKPTAEELAELMEYADFLKAMLAVREIAATPSPHDGDAT